MDLYCQSFLRWEKKTLYMRLYDNNILTTATVWATLLLYGLLSICFFLFDVWTSAEKKR